RRDDRRGARAHPPARAAPGARGERLRHAAAVRDADGPLPRRRALPTHAALSPTRAHRRDPRRLARARAGRGAGGRGRAPPRDVRPRVDARRRHGAPPARRRDGRRHPRLAAARRLALARRGRPDPDHDRIRADGAGLMVRSEDRGFTRGRRPSLGEETPSASDRFGQATEWIARAMGTPWFLVILTLFCVLWMAWNTIAPEEWRFDSAAIGFTALTLILSLQASYAAPLILLAQNRQDDRDRVQIEQDRQRAERNLADTEYLAREVVALRLVVRELASKDFIRAELRSLLEELDREKKSESVD